MRDAPEFPKENPMIPYLWVAGLLAGWILLQTWILPKFGISTCMSKACRAEQKKNAGD